jgi:hypothetical protein
VLDGDRLRSFRRLTAPVLSAYIDTNPATRRNQGHPPGYLAWLKTSTRRLQRRVAADERKAFQETVRRLEREFRTRPARARAIVAFIGPRTREVLRLQVAVDDELHWGPPALKQLFWLLDEHRPAGVVVVSRTEARFFRVWLGEVLADDREPIVLDTAGWRRKDLVGPSHGGVGKRRGVQRDRFASRVEAQHRRFAATLASRVEPWAERHGLRPVLLVGPSAMIDAVSAALSAALRPRVATLPENLAHLSPAALHARVQPALARWQRDDEAARVDALLRAGGSRHVAVGLEQTLTELQEGRVRELLVARGIKGTVGRCEQCGWADTSASAGCVRCGGRRRRVAVRVLLPELARRSAASIDVVAGPAAKRLRQADGIGATLHSNRGGARRGVA